MGQRGPKPTPTAILRARGSWRAAARTRDPVTMPARPSPPRWLRVAARHYWEQLIDRVCAMRVMSNADAEALAALCDQLLLYDRCKAIVEREGVVSETAEGRPIVHPAQKLMGETLDRMVRLFREFGMTPSARSTVRTVEEKTPTGESDADRFLRLG